MSNKCIVCFIAFLDFENIWFGEIILSLSKLLTTICSLQLFHGGHFEFCMLIMSNRCIICFIAFPDFEHIHMVWWNNIDSISIIDDKRVLTPICELHQTFFLFCGPFWTFTYRWHILTSEFSRDYTCFCNIYPCRIVWSKCPWVDKRVKLIYKPPASQCPLNTNAGLMLCQRGRRWANPKTSLGQYAACRPADIMYPHIRHIRLTQCWFNGGPLTFDIGLTSKQHCIPGMLVLWACITCSLRQIN